MQRGILRPSPTPTPSCCVCHAGGEAQPRFVEEERSHVKVGTNTHKLTEADLDKAAAIIVLAAAKVFKCLVKGMLIVLWLYMIDFLRRISSQGDGIISAMIVICLAPVACFVSPIFCYASELLDEYIPTSA